MDMPPLTSPDKPMDPVSWRILLLLACVLVFSFALHAKVAIYEHASHPSPSTSSKLWVNGAKWQPLPIAPAATFAWLAVFFTWFLAGQSVHRYKPASASIERQQRRQHYLHRFLRPPPSR